MKILRKIPFAIAIIGMMVMVASCQTPTSDGKIEITVLEEDSDSFALGSRLIQIQ